MIDLESVNFDDLNYAELVKEAMEWLPMLDRSWTDFNAHDPGITFLELLAWLTESQRYFLNRITKSHKQKYLKLMGLKQRSAEPARLPTVFAPKKNEVRRGYSTSIGGIPFTLEEDIAIGGQIAYEDGERKGYGFLPFGENPRKGDCFFFELEYDMEGCIKFFVELNGIKREPMQEGYCPLAQIRLDILCGDTWSECEIVDKSYGFMQSGEISAILPCAGKKFRVVLTRCDIDVPPMLERIYPYYTELVQYKEVYGGQENAHLAQYGHLVATFRREGDYYVVADDGERAIFAEWGYKGEYFVEDNQINLNIAPLFVVEEDFCLLVREGDVFRQWQAVSDLAGSKPTDRHFVIDNLAGVLRFGDNINGMAADSAIIACMRLTYGARGKIKSNHQYFLSGAEAFNPFHSVGGYDPESIEDGCPADMRGMQRAVTEDDYMDLVMKTPALCAKGVKVFCNEDGIVNICVDAEGGLKKPHIYNIRRLLEEKRLPCTEVKITAPRFFEGICVLNICVSDWAFSKNRKIYRFINQYFADLEKVFGLHLPLEKACLDLEQSPFIKKAGLRIVGRNLVQNGEILLPPDGLLRIVDKDITLVHE